MSVRATIKKSYGTISGLVTVFFKDQKEKSVILKKCYTYKRLALILFFKNFTEGKGKILELTCTEQQEKLHQISKKGSIPMVRLKIMKHKSAS